MVKKTFDDLTPEQTEALTDDQYNDLMQNGSVDLPEEPATGKQQEKKEEVSSKQEDVKEPVAEEGKQAQPQTPAKTVEERLAEMEARIQELIRANRGKDAEISRLRQKKRELESGSTEQSELVKKILSIPDGEFLESTPIKEAILAEQKKQEETERQRQARIDQIEEEKELAMLKYEDYEEVINKGLPAFVSTLPEDKQKMVINDITNSYNPPETAYQYGKRGMGLVNKQTTKQPSAVPPVNAGKEQPVILRSGKGSKVSPEDKSLHELVFGTKSAEELERLAIETEKELERGG